MSKAELHPWAHPITLAYIPAFRDHLIDAAIPEMLEWLRANGTTVQDTPTNDTDLIITTARFTDPVKRDDALLFHGKRKYGLSRRPQVLTVVSMTEAEYAELVQHFAALAENSAEALSLKYQGLGPQAIEVLLEQAQRGGPEVALGRLLQGQNKSIRVMALIGDNAGKPVRAIHYDLAGAHPTTDARDLAYFAEDAGQAAVERDLRPRRRRARPAGRNAAQGHLGQVDHPGSHDAGRHDLHALRLLHHADFHREGIGLSRPERGHCGAI